MGTEKRDRADRVQKKNPKSPTLHKNQNTENYGVLRSFIIITTTEYYYYTNYSVLHTKCGVV